MLAPPAPLQCRIAAAVESGRGPCCDDLFSTGGGRNIGAVTGVTRAIKLLQERYKMQRIGLKLMPAVLALVLAIPAVAQNSGSSQGTTTTITSNPILCIL